MSSPHTPENLCRQLFQVLDSFTHQTITDLDQGTLPAVRERLDTWVAQLDEEHLWRLGIHTLPFALHDHNRHLVGVLAVRELATEIRVTQQDVLHRHITLAQPRFIWHVTS